MVADFQVAGMSALLREIVKGARQDIPDGPRFLKWRIVSPSGPGAVEVPEALNAARTMSGVKGLKLKVRGCLRRGCLRECLEDLIRFEVADVNW